MMNDELKTETTPIPHSSLIAHHSSLAICLVSGGMDSCVTAAIAREENREVAFLHVTYGQRTARRERQAFDDIADFYNVERRLVVSLEALARIGGSSLTDENLEVERHERAEEISREIPSSYVPFRNAHLLATAASWAEVTGANRLYIGAVAEDSSGYPDCRAEFYEAFQKTVDVGTRPETHVEIVTPIINLRKSGIVRCGIELGAPLHLTWSCYTESEKACGRCDSCLLRLRGFAEAGRHDPLQYAAVTRET
ncbi:MAG: 7-cyano-7-deazaguanine synthase QueC [Pyrinomonadaceae bacterium MAG19_C2-C3]|nr:7-cyano-7-deazaguanine synthase QueC [Pyrinomonadaceae bacterium MAG19_C2-C3]